jgi:hypothetical protein
MADDGRGFFGWRVVAAQRRERRRSPVLAAVEGGDRGLGFASAALEIFGWGIGFCGPPIYMHAVPEAHGWTLEVVSGAVTVHLLAGTLVIANLPHLPDRRNAETGRSRASEMLPDESAQVRDQRLAGLSRAGITRFVGARTVLHFGSSSQVCTRVE